MKARTLFALCMFLAVGYASAGSFEDGIAAYDRHDYATALRLWLPLAEQGHRSAQFNIGFLHEKGLGVPLDSREAIKWYAMAADQGDSQAQYNLALLYETGAAQDIDEARKWYRLIMANPSTDPQTLELKRRGRARLAALTSVKEEIVSYVGGRFVIVRSSEGPCVVALQGGITRQAVSRFDDVIDKSTALGCVDPWLMLESPGGLLFDALDLGRKIRRAKFRTAARSGCASACAFLFLGGIERVLAGSAAKIGFHQPSRRDVCDPFAYTTGARDTHEYLRSVIPAQADEVMDIIMRTSCKDIEWVSGQRALALGVATRLEWEGVAVRPMRNGPVAGPSP